MSAMSIFSKMMAGDIPAKFIYQDEHCVVVNDIHPQAAVHMLVIPRKPLVSLAEAEVEDQTLLGHLLLIAAKMAKNAGIEHGFRLIANNGKGAGQTVFHLHFHVLGNAINGKTFSESSIGNL